MTTTDMPDRRGGSASTPSTSLTALAAAPRGSRRSRLLAMLPGMRAAVVAACFLYYVLNPADDGNGVAGVLLLLVIFTVITAVSTPRREGIERIGPLPEAVIASIVIVAAMPQSSPMVIYLLIPVLAAWLEAGRVSAIVVGATVAAAILLPVVVIEDVFGLWRDSGPDGDTTAQGRWAFLGMALGFIVTLLLASTRFRVQRDTYADAQDLLVRLRDIARALPVGLDEATAASRLLDDIRATTAVDRATILAGRSQDSLSALPSGPWPRMDWPVDHAPRLPLRGGPVTRDAGERHLAFLPLTLASEPVAVVMLERSSPWLPDQLETAAEIVRRGAVQLDASRLFSEIRTLATMEERRRLSREIHDGIAQDIASIGYQMDDLVARLEGHPHLDEAREVRRALSGLVGELRLSIFDLRNDIEAGAALSSALHDYVRSVGAESGLTVHLVLEDDSDSLPREVEAHMLRIAQEAVTNVRRHAQADNLWLTYRAHGAGAYLRIADDGRGPGPIRSDSFGMEIMRERAARIGAELSLRERSGGGTVVEVRLDPVPTPT